MDAIPRPEQIIRLRRACFERSNIDRINRGALIPRDPQLNAIRDCIFNQLSAQYPYLRKPGDQKMQRKSYATTCFPFTEFAFKDLRRFE